MPHRADYRWFIDWDDNDYRHPLAEIPRHHVNSYSLDWGTSLTPDGPSVGLVAGGSGQLTLLDPDGRYYRTMPLTRNQLELPHRFKLEIEGEAQRSGRASPVVAGALGIDVQPTTWALAGERSAQFPESEPYSFADGGVLADVLADVEEKSGIPVTSRATQEFDDIEWAGSWAGLLNSLANLIGGWAVELGDGSVELIDAVDIGSAESTFTFDRSHGVGIDSGIGLQTALVRTRVVSPEGTGPFGGTLVVGNEDRYGRRPLSPRFEWLTSDASLESVADVFQAFLYRTSPHTYVRASFVDIQRNQAQAAAIAGNLVPGRQVTGILPTPDGEQIVKFLVLRVRLDGGEGRVPRRIVHGLGVVAGTVGLIGQPTFVIGRGGSSAMATITSVADGGTRYWRYRRDSEPLGWTDTESYAANTVMQVLALTGLTPHTDYVFQVALSDDFETGLVEAPFVTTPPMTPPLEPFDASVPIRGIAVVEGLPPTRRRMPSDFDTEVPIRGITFL